MKPIKLFGRKRKVVYFLVILCLIITFFLAEGWGGGTYSFAHSLALFSSTPLSEVEETILFRVRLPRIVLSWLVGSGLSLAGAVLQGLFRNPLVDPYVLGISSGAAFGAVVAIYSGIYWGLFTIPLFAFGFALFTAFLVFYLGRIGQKMPLEVLLLSGVAVGFFFSSLISLGMYLAGENLHQMVFWMMGGFYSASWEEVKMVLPFFLVSLPLLLPFNRELNAFLLGEKVAESMGVEVERVKKLLLFISSVLVASCVAVSGVIGFVGLIVPHLVRLLVGPDHRHLLPLSFLLGGVVLIWADTLARTVIHPIELPVGIVTNLLGVPFFIFLLRRRKSN
ncbi:MAG: cobalamin transport system permease protein [Candidatus Atribacteria bacterium]|nr:cobalamin transport system permease protein [Candidatus Atribacteria bacterium]